MMEKKTISKIIGLYLIEVVIGFLYVSRFTVPVHAFVDEELYLAMAKSFHYGQGFLQYGNCLNYKAVLYSCVISVAYFFYSPEKILLYIRFINVLLMGSAIFPIFLLAEKVIEDKKKAIMVTLLLSFVPEMAMTGYIMQEVLYYPLLLWAIYFMYMDIKRDEVSVYTILTPLFYMLAFFTKTVGFIFPIIYVAYLFVNSIFIKKLNIKILINTMICAFLFVLGSCFIGFVNGGNGTNHYSTQVSNLFPITFTTLRSFIVGSIFYIACTIVSMGIFATIIPLYEREKYDNKDKKFIYLILSFVIVSIAEIILLVVYTENRDFIYPKKYLYRYLFPLFVPLFIFMVKAYERKDYNKFISGIKKVSEVGLFSSIVLLIYYIIAGTNISSGIVDSLLFTTLTNIINHVWRYFGIACSILLMVFCLIILCASNGVKEDNYKKTVKVILSSYTIYFLMFDIINFIQLPYYNNVICNGDQNEEQFMEIAEWLNNNEHDKMIYVCSGYDPQNSLWGYIKEDYTLYSYEEYLNDYNTISEENYIIVIDKATLNELNLEFGKEMYVTNDYVIMGSQRKDL